MIRDSIDVTARMRAEKLLRIINKSAVKVMIKRPYANTRRRIAKEWSNMISDQVGLDLGQHQSGWIVTVYRQRLVLNGDGMQSDAQ